MQVNKFFKCVLRELRSRRLQEITAVRLQLIRDRLFFKNEPTFKLRLLPKPLLVSAKSPSEIDIYLYTLFPNLTFEILNQLSTLKANSRGEAPHYSMCRQKAIPFL